MSAQGACRSLRLGVWASQERPQPRRGPARGAPASASRASAEAGLERLLDPLFAPSKPTDAPQLAQTRQQAAPQPAAALAAAALAGGVAVVAADVCAPASLHLLAPLDAAAHAWVSTHLEEQVQRFVAGKLISDAAIVAGLAGWAAVAAAALRAPHPPLLRGLAACGALYLLAGGSIRHGDTPLVAALKEGFERARPSPRHATFAFPSGHTTAATFICGALLFVLLPLALDALEQQRRQQEQQEGGEQQPPGAAAAGAAWLVQRRWPLVGGAAAVTGAGRILADAHWCSDVLAGGLLGAALTAAAVQLCAVGSASPLLLDLLQPPRRE